jgi:Protein of unknown function (DUF2630)
LNWAPDRLTVIFMTAFPGPELSRPQTKDDLAPKPEGLDLFAHIEHLCSEEDRLLAISEHERSEHEHERLRATRAELDRIWEHLRQRAERVARRPPSQS